MFLLGTATTVASSGGRQREWRHERFEIGLVLAIVAIVVVMVVRALGGGEDSKAVAASEVRQALRELPYSYRFRHVRPSDGGERVVTGTAYGRGGTVVHFGAAFGQSPDPVPLPEREPRGRWS
jgi:hypothetical protein